jgi:hypothetical protein
MVLQRSIREVKKTAVLFLPPFFIFTAKNSGMKRLRNIGILILAIALTNIACQQESGNQESEGSTPDLQTALPGTWEAVSIRVDIPTVDSTEYDSVFTVSEEYWVDKFRIQPVKTYFQADNKYRQEFRNSMDSLLNEVKGIWNVFGDTLMLIEPNASNTYLVEIGKGLVTLKATVDWDGDGQTDDTYKAVHRKISSSY